MKEKIVIKGKIDLVKLGKEISRERNPMSTLKGKIEKSKKQYNRKKNKKIKEDEKI